MGWPGGALGSGRNRPGWSHHSPKTSPPSLTIQDSPVPLNHCPLHTSLCRPASAGRHLPLPHHDPVQGGRHVSSCQPNLLIRRCKCALWHFCNTPMPARGTWVGKAFQIVRTNWNAWPGFKELSSALLGRLSISISSPHQSPPPSLQATLGRGFSRSHDPLWHVNPKGPKVARTISWWCLPEFIGLDWCPCFSAPFEIMPKL